MPLEVVDSQEIVTGQLKPSVKMINGAHGIIYKCKRNIKGISFLNVFFLKGWWR